MKKTTTLVLCLGLALYSQAQDFEMLKDFDPSGSGNPGSFMEYDDKLYFSAYDGSERELWVSDGTAAGTQLFKDINPAGSGFPSAFTVCNGKLYFVAEDDTHGRELWVSDGTPAGTQMVKDIHPSGDGLPGWLTAVGDKLYFSADDGVHGRELWVTDGTTAGTELIDIAPNIAGRPPGSSYPENLTVFNGDLYFSVLGRMLYKLESSSGSFQPVKILISSSDLSNSRKMSDFYVYNDQLYFSGDDDVHGRELWVSDGSTAGTTILKDIHPSGASFPYNFIEYAGNLYFVASDGTHGAELWVTDGTESGTQMLADINPSGGSSGAEYFVIYNGKLYFNANHDVYGWEVWMTDGTTAGTQLLKDFSPTGDGVFYKGVGNKVYNDKLYIIASDGSNGFELWQSDGTEAGTEKIQPAIATESNPVSQSSFIIFDGSLYFSAEYNSSGRELWKLTTEDPNPPSGVHQWEEQLALQVYPNPASDQIRLRMNAPIDEIILYNSLGQRILSQKSGNNQQLNVSALAPGMYMLRINVMDHWLTRKVSIR